MPGIRLAACIATAALVSCAAPAPPPAPAPKFERIVLLPDPDGKVGGLVVRTGSSERLLDTAYAAAVVDARTQEVRVEPAGENATRQRYAAEIGALPPPPRSFTVNYQLGSASEFAAASRTVVEELKAYLASHPAPEITVIGHTDRVGSEEFNDKLSLERAQAMQRLLQGLNIRALRIEVAGRGERELLVDTADGVAEERNRRVEISVR